MYRRLILLIVIANIASSFIPILKYPILFQNCNVKAPIKYNALAEITHKEADKTPTLDISISKDVLPSERMLLFFAAQEARKARRLYDIDMESNVGEFLLDFFGSNTNEVISNLREILQSNTNIAHNLIEAVKYYCNLPPFQNITNNGTRIQREQLWILAAEAFATVLVTLRPSPLKQQLIKTLLINYSLLPGSIDWISTDWIIGNDEYQWKLFDRHNMIDSLRLLKEWIPNEFIKRRSRRLLEKLSDQAISSLFQTILAPHVWATPSLGDSAAQEWMHKRLLRRSFSCKTLDMLINLIKSHFTNDELISFLESAFSVLPEVSNPELIDRINPESLQKLAVVAINRIKYKRSNNEIKPSYIHFKPKELNILGFNGGYMPLVPTRTCLIQMLLHPDNFNYGNCDLQQKLITRFQMQAKLSKLPMESLYELVEKSLNDTDVEEADNRTDQLNMISSFFYKIKGLEVEGIVGKIQSMQQIELADQDTLNRVEAKLIELIENDPLTELIETDYPIEENDIPNANKSINEVDDKIKFINTDNGVELSKLGKFSLNALPGSFDYTYTNVGNNIIPINNINDKLNTPFIHNDNLHLYKSLNKYNNGNNDSKFKLNSIPTFTESQGQLLEFGTVSKWRELLNDSLSTVAKCLVGDEPTEIQKEAIPSILKGKNVFMCGGYGKTLAAALPLIQLLKNDEQSDWSVRQLMRPRMLVLAPSRELCNEILTIYKSIGHIEKISTECLAGGKWFGKQRKENNRIVDVIIGTPARVLRHSITKNNIRLNNVRYVVLDEVDELIAGGYSEELEAIFKLIPNFQLISCAPWNAYQHPKFMELSNKFTEYFTNTTCIYDNSLHKPPGGAIHQFLLKGKRGGRDKIGVLLDELRWGRDKFHENHKCIVFCNTIQCCRAVLHSLVEAGFDAMGYYGEVPLMKRKENYERFCNQGGILVATQSRGLNFYGDNSNPISVINFDFPSSWIEYIIRANRTRGFGGGRITSLIDTKSRYLALGISRSIKADLPLKGLSRHKSAYNPLTGRLRYLTQSGGYFKILNEIRRAEIEGDGTFNIYDIVSRLYDKDANPKRRRSVRLSLEHDYRKRRRIFRVLLHKLKLIKRWNRAIRLKHKLLNKYPHQGWRRPRFPSMKKESPIRKAMSRVIQHLGTNYNYKTHERNLMLTKKLVKKHLRITRHLLSLLRSHKIKPSKEGINTNTRQVKFLGFERKKRTRQCVLI